MGRKSPPSNASVSERELTVTSIGARGDGLAEDGGGRVFLPFTVAGDRVRARLGPATAEGRRGEVTAWLERGPGRAEPMCRYFGRCGGCTLQHLSRPDYLAWKAGQVSAALARASLESPSPLPVAETPPGGRRRASFSLARRGGAVLAGFRERLSHRLVDVGECPVLAPALVGLLPLLRHHLVAVLPEAAGAEASATLLDGGIDLVLTGPSRLDLAARHALADLAESADLGRLCWRPDDRSPTEPVAARRTLRASFAGTAVEPPPAGFLQASREGEAALIAAVLAGAGDGQGPVADLFAGCGTFSLPLLKTGRRVHAVEGDGAALAALSRAASGNAALTVEGRDLERRPLSVAELGRFAVVVFDPPRAGAAAQAAALAESAVPAVVAVSCNPATFARDARLLASGGYRLAQVLAVDQFLWSAHVELVATFRRS